MGKCYSKKNNKYVDEYIENFPIGIIHINDSFNIIKVNAKINDILGYGEGELYNKNINCLIPPVYHKRHNIYMKNFLNNKYQLNRFYSMNALNKNGKMIQLYITINPLNKNIIEIILNNFGKSEQNLIRTEILAKISHDIRSPIHVIKSLTEDDPSLNTDKKYILKSCNYILNLTDSIINNDKELKNEEIKTTEILDFILKIKENEIQKKNINFIFNTVQYFYQDKTVILRILSNIINNCIKYIPNKNNNYIKINIRIINNTINIIIKDNGNGMSQEKIENINKMYKNYRKKIKIHMDLECLLLKT